MADFIDKYEKSENLNGGVFTSLILMALQVKSGW